MLTASRSFAHAHRRNFSRRRPPPSFARAFTASPRSTTPPSWREYIAANPHAYAPGGPGYEQIRAIVNSLSHTELQTFVNLGGAAKSFGSMSADAWMVEHLGFNIARSLVAERLGVPLSTAPGPRSNSGEGGQLSSSALSSLGMGSLGAGAASRQTIASIVQVASGRWMGESPLDYLVNAEEIDIKVAQGVKPGDGGHLPASKTTPLIAEVRGAAPHRDLYSPPPHHDIYSVEDLAQLIHDLRQVNPLARKIWVKLASRSGVGPVSLVVAKAGAGVEVTGFGGTGAAKAESKHFYVRDKTPGILEVRNTLIAEGLWPIDLGWLSVPQLAFVCTRTGGGCCRFKGSSTQNCSDRYPGGCSSNATAKWLSRMPWAYWERRAEKVAASPALRGRGTTLHSGAA